MDGSLTLEAALEQRLEIINCKPADIKRFIATYPPQKRMVPVSQCKHGNASSAHLRLLQNCLSCDERTDAQTQVISVPHTGVVIQTLALLA